MFETAKLNLKLMKTKMDIAKTRLEEQRLLTEYLLTIAPEKFLLLTLLAAVSIFADAFTTVLIMNAGGTEINPLTVLFNRDVYGNFNYMLYYNSQIYLGQILILFGVIYVVLIQFAVAVNDEELANSKSVELIRKFSDLARWVLGWVVLVRGFITVWNLAVVMMI